MNRLHQILLGVLVVQLALVGFVFWPRSTSANAAGAPLLGQVKADDVATLTITDKQGSTKLAKQGDQWVVPDADNYPADAAKINPLITKLVALKGDRLVTTTTASQSQLQVADDNYVSKVDLQGASGTNYTIYLGSMTGGSSTHVRVGGQSNVYLASDIYTWDVKSDVSSWVDTAYLSMPSENVTAMTVKNANGELVFTKDAQGKWQLADLAAGEQLNDSAVSSLVSLASSVRLTRPLGKQDKPEYGMAQPLATVILKAKKDNADVTYTLQVGAKDSSDNTYVAKLADSEYYVRVNSYGVDDLVTKKHSDFLVVPTPVPTGTPASGN